MQVHAWCDRNDTTYFQPAKQFSYTNKIKVMFGMLYIKACIELWYVVFDWIGLGSFFKKKKNLMHFTAGNLSLTVNLNN